MSTSDEFIINYFYQNSLINTKNEDDVSEYSSINENLDCYEYDNDNSYSLSWISIENEKNEINESKNDDLYLYEYVASILDLL
jgi:hypothetical protein